MRRGVPWLGFWLCAVLLSACEGGKVDLGAVGKYAKTTEAARASFDAIAADYDASCLRIREYQIDPALARIPPPTPLAADAFAHPPSDSDADDPDALAPLPEAVPSAAASPTATPGASERKRSATTFFPVPRAPEECVELGQPQTYPVGILSADWRKADDALLAFVAGIGKIANVGDPPKPTDKLTSALVDAKAMTKAQATAVNAVALAIARYFVRHRQQQSIAEFVEQVNPRFAEASDALVGVANAYHNVVDAECEVKDSFYERSLAVVRDGYLVPMPARSPAATNAADVLYSEQYVAYGIRAEWAEARADCRRRLDAIPAYVKTVEAIAATEADIDKDARSPGSVDLGADADDVMDAVDNLYALTRPPPAKAPAPAKKG